MSSKMVSISVPAGMEDEISKYIEKLHLEHEGMEISEDEDESEDDPNERETCEVDKITKHRIDANGEYHFYIKFKGSKFEWIKDSDTDCEQSIINYKNIPTVYVFCRVSTKGQIGEDHVSLDAQESELLKMANERYPEHRVKSYKISASAYKSIPDVLQMIGEVAQKGSHILIYRVDRLSRNIVKYLGWLEDLNDRGVGIHAFANKISYDVDKLVFIQSVLDSQKESALISDRIKMSIKKRKERGDEGVGNLVYGKKYFRNVDGGKLVIVDNIDEKKTIDYIKQSKKSSALVASLLNKKGLKKRGKKWSLNMINKIRPVLKKKK